MDVPKPLLKDKPMTDRPALAEALGHAVDRWLETMPGTSVPEIVFERVLAEHETTQWARRLAEDSVVAGEVETTGYTALQDAIRRAEAAEARCAQLEQELSHAQGDLDYCRGERASIDAILEDRDEGTTYLKVEALLAEHERLRAALEEAIEFISDTVPATAEYVLPRLQAALAPSQEPK